MISSDLTTKHGIPTFIPKNLPEFEAVNGIKIRVNGCVHLTVRHPKEEKDVSVYAIVSPDISHEILFRISNFNGFGSDIAFIPDSKIQYKKI